jgi:DNA polymerase III sliding clamp (beta) subunit (PCNA family)
MNQITLKAETIIALIKSVKNTIDKNCPTKIMSTIKMDVSEGCITASACDGFRVMQARVAYDKKEVTPFTFYMDTLDIPKDVESVEIREIENGAEVELFKQGAKILYKFETPEGKFPDLSVIIPRTDEALTVELNAKKLIELLKPFAKQKDKDHRVRLSFGKVQSEGIGRSSPKLEAADTVCGLVDGIISYQAIILPLRKLENERN